MFGHDRSDPAHRPTRHSAGELEDLLLSTDVVEHFLKEFVGSVASAIGGDVSAGVTLFLNGRAATFASSDARAARYDDAQYGPTGGPYLTALRTRVSVLVDDLAGDARFTGYRLLALALGVRSCLSLPLDGGDHGLGALNLYSRHAHAFGPSVQAEAQRLADEASRLLSLTLHLAQEITISAQLRAALTSPSVINEAVGIVMSEYWCDADVAFALLGAASRDRRVTLGVVASEIATAVTKDPPAIGDLFRT